MKKFLNSKNIVLLALFIITFILLVFSVIFHFKVPVNVSYDSNSFDLYEVKSDDVVVEEFISNVSELESVRLSISDVNLKDDSVFISIYNYDNELIYYNDFTEGQNFDGVYINYVFPKVNDSLNKKFKIKIEAKNIEKDNYLKIRLINEKLDNLDLSINDDSQNSYMPITEYGYSVTSFYKVLFMFILAVIAIIFIRINFVNNEKIKEFLLKKGRLYILEFLSSIGTFLSLLKVITNSHYYGYTSIPWLLLLCLCGFILTFILTIFIGDKKLKLEKHFLLIAIPVSIMYLIFVLPMNIPDEYYHYKIAYSVSEFSMFNHKIAVPNAIKSYSSYKMFFENLFVGNYESLEIIKNGSYNPLLYLFSGIGIFIGRLLNLPPLLGSFLGSGINTIIYLCLGYYIIKKIPVCKLLMLVYLLNPMFVHQATSFSGDALINISSMLFIGYVLYIYYEKKDVNKRDFLILLSSLTFVFIGKYAYFPIGLLLLLIFKPLKKFIKENKKIFITTVIIAFTVFFGWLIYSKLPYNDPDVVENIKDYVSVPAQQVSKLGHLLKNPSNFIPIYFRTLNKSIEFYLFSFFGYRLGPLNIAINMVYILLYIIILVLALFSEKSKYGIDKKNRIINIIIFILIFNIILLGLYLGWGIVTDIVIEGVQGRYFIPINILLFMTFFSKDRYIKFKNPYLLVTFGLLITHLLIMTNVLNYFLN